MGHRSFLPFLALLLLATAAPLRAQLLWERSSDGVEGAHLTRLFRTPDGAILAAAGNGIVRFDRDGGRWLETLRRRTARDNGRVFASDGRGDIYSADGAILLRSTDDGRSWVAIDSTTMVVQVDDSTVLLYNKRGRSVDGARTWRSWQSRQIATIIPTGGGRLVGVHYDTLFESLDTGHSWRPLARVAWWPRMIVAVDSATLLAGDLDVLRRSTDAGRTWTITDSLPGATALRLRDGSVLLSSFGDGLRASDGLHRSTDGGLTWRLRSRGLAESIAEGPDGEIWADHAPFPARSTDGGRTWRREVTGLSWRGGRLFTGADGAIYGMIVSSRLNTGNGGSYPYELVRTDDDGRSWRSLLDTVASVNIAPDGRLMVANVATLDSVVSPSFVLRRTRVSTDRGDTWRTVHEGPSVAAANAEGMAVTLAWQQSAASPPASLLVTTDHGATWQRHGSAANYYQVALSPEGTVFTSMNVYLPDGTQASGVHRSDDSGRSFRVVADSVHAWQIHAYGNGVVVVVTYATDTVRKAQVLRSTDNGETWSTTLSGYYPWHMVRDSSALVLFGYTDPRTGAVLVSRSLDSGLTWQHSYPTHGIARERPTHSHGNEIFAYPDDALLRTVDHGATWQVVDSGSAFGSWYSATTNGRVMIASPDGLWRTGAPAAVRLEPAERVQGTLALAPVPARDVVTIETRCGGRLRVVDARGTLMLERTLGAPGRHIVDIGALAEGLHLVSVECGGEMSVGRILVRR